MITNKASNTAGINICPTATMLKPAPSEKKKMIRKKSRSGLSFSVINRAMGLEARVTPAIKAPISRDRPMTPDSSATPRHQAMARRNMYSWIWSKRIISFSTT